MLSITHSKSFKTPKPTFIDFVLTCTLIAALALEVVALAWLLHQLRRMMPMMPIG